MKLFINSLKINPLTTNYQYPSWWVGEEIPVTYNDDGVYTSYNIESNVSDILLETPYYLDVAGSDTNGGLSSGDALKTLSQAISLGAKLVYLNEGVYPKDRVNYTPTITNDLAVIGVGNVVVTAHDDAISWTAYNSIYKVTDIGYASVLDKGTLDLESYWNISDIKISIAEVEAQAGSHYSDGVDLYVNPTGSINDVYVNWEGTYIYKSDSRFYFKNITHTPKLELLVGNVAPAANDFYLKSITVPYPSRTDGVLGGPDNIEVRNARAMLQDCYTRYANSDCYSYTNYNRPPNNCVEINCVAKYPSYYGTAGGSDQCSTAHVNVPILRINCDYTDGANQSIADVSDTQTIILGGVYRYVKSIGSGNYRFVTCTNGEAFKSQFLNSDGTNIGQEAGNGGTFYITDCVSEHTKTIGDVIITP